MRDGRFAGEVPEAWREYKCCQWFGWTIEQYRAAPWTTTDLWIELHNLETEARAR